MIKGRDLVLVSGDFARYPSSFEHLLRRFAPDNRLIWVETIGMRRPTLSWFDVKRAAGKLARLSNTNGGAFKRPLPQNLTVVAPPMWPFHDVSWVKRYNDTQMTQATLKEITRRGFKDFALITTVPLAAGLGKRLGASSVTYYCMDDWTHWPGLLKDAIPLWEHQLLEEADLVIVTSDELQRTKSPPGKPAKLLPHGVDVMHFAGARKTTSSPIRLLTYFGLFDARTDQAILRAIAMQRPEVTIAIVGPVQVDVSSLKSLPNVRFTGPVSYDLLPQALHDSDVLLLPYRLDHLAKSINPLKVRECLATGKPVVTMALDELRHLPGLIQAKTATEFVERCLALIDGSIETPKVDLQQFLAESSWEARAETLSGWLKPLFARARS